ncbi:hypothetical protein ColLi_09083 [Colletotrichum liriopes]|uniref:Uncharacterized protein n=1 Tax=Colletotrichum liriopes TaxID=708192 RepID=A0AA37LUV4_9PEZI|nr:hypothetical protein ColLi_09083 [Colletotrichum liriopes]
MGHRPSHYHGSQAATTTASEAIGLIRDHERGAIQPTQGQQVKILENHVFSVKSPLHQPTRR